MKKFLLSLVLVASFNAFAQVEISFESSEGYNLGEINNQNDWTLLNASATNTMNSSLANVSSNRASDGTWSLHVDSDGSEWNYFAGVLSPEINGFEENYDIEFSFYPESNVDSDYLFQVFDLDGQDFVSVIVFRFTWTGLVQLWNGTAYVTMASSYPANVWHDIKISRTPSSHLFYLNDELLLTMDNYGTGSAAKFVGFRYDNYGSGFSIDNFKVDSSLSTPDFEKNTFKHFVDANGLNLSADALISNVAIYNVSGQQLINQRLNATTGTINTNGLSNGVYLAQVEIDGVTTTVKFIK